MVWSGARGLIARNAVAGARGKHARCAVAVTMALLTATMLVPAQAFAATELTIDGSATPYTSAASGATWTWDGADDLTLNNYNGGKIAAEGNLKILSTGTNTVTSTDSAAILTTGDLSISGTGTLEANSTKTQDYDSAAGISAEDVIIDGTTVTTTATSTGAGESAYGIATVGQDENTGNINIQNGANVTAKATSASAHGPAVGLFAFKGDVNITDSTVNVSASNSDDPYVAGGIYANGYADVSGGTPLGGNVSISDSAVKVNAIAAVLAITNSEATPGMLTITESRIVAPEGYAIRDIVVLEEPDSIYGQTIGAPGAGAIASTTDPAIATNVEIVADKPTDNTTQQASTATDALPKTGDNTTGLAAFGALGLAGLAALAVAFTARRRTHESE